MRRIDEAIFDDFGYEEDGKVVYVGCCNEECNAVAEYYKPEVSE